MTHGSSKCRACILNPAAHSTTIATAKRKQDFMEESTTARVQLPVGLMKLHAPRHDSLARFLIGNVPRNDRPAPLGASPMDGIINHALDQRVVINRIGFVSRTEIKNPTAPAHPTVAAAEHLSPFEP